MPVLKFAVRSLQEGCDFRFVSRYTWMPLPSRQETESPKSRYSGDLQQELLNLPLKAEAN